MPANPDDLVPRGGGERRPRNLRALWVVLALVVVGGGIGLLRGDGDSGGWGVPPTTADALAEFSALTLDGERIVIREGGDVSFTDGVPDPIAIINGMSTCASVGFEYSFWLGFDASGLSEAGQKRISAYARFALNRMSALAC